MHTKITRVLQNYFEMKRIKAFALLLGVVVLASCASQKRVIYLQDTQADEQIKSPRIIKYASSRWTV